MRRYWVEKDQISKDHVELTGDTFHHICVVCRQEEGDKFEILTEGHKAFFVVVEKVSKKTATAKILETRTIPELPFPRIHLCLSLPRPNRISEIVEKAVETGVFEIHPLISEHSYFRDVKSIPANMISRAEKVIKGATQQSGRGDLMAVRPATTLRKKLEEINQDKENRCLMAYEGGSAQPALEALQASDFAKAKNIYVFIGSEGGFSADEAKMLSDAGSKVITLGSQILRVETACVVMAAILRYQLNQLA